MPDRPCRPDADLQWLWRIFLPDAKAPVCGVAGEQRTANGNVEEPKSELRDERRRKG